MEKSLLISLLLRVRPLIMVGRQRLPNESVFGGDRSCVRDWRRLIQISFNLKSRTRLQRSFNIYIGVNYNCRVSVYRDISACPKLYQNPDCKCAARKEEVQEVEFANIAVMEK